MTLEMEDICSPDRLVHFGRVAYHNYKTKFKSTGELLGLLMQKLWNGQSHINIPDKEVHITTVQALAIVGPHVCLDIVPQSVHASELTASHLAYAHYISSSGESLYVSYPSEPILAEASAQIMNRIC